MNPLPGTGFFRPGRHCCSSATRVLIPGQSDDTFRIVDLDHETAVHPLTRIRGIGKIEK
ncbi:MAG TPA: hypothetical protein VLY46_04370 [Usitatibacter sp.]|nr:hypothetical protein [Usitatibacter sp.]